ncbi:molybdopterin biosynthesis protein MoeB [Planctomycetes bacterium MalM25]|nr:molybdopterin biosynthesis protein MoeB [Planctomycetes bacterium MalM25]
MGQARQATTSDHRPLRLVVRPGAWSDFWRAATDNEAPWGVGRMRSIRSASTRQWFVDELALRDSQPTGGEFSPVESWLVVTLMTEGSPTADQLDGIMRRLAPRPSQTVGLLAVGGTDRSEWNARLWRGDERSRIDTIEVPGPGMLRLSQAASQEAVPARASRTVGALGKRVATRVREASVTLIGAGGNGWLMAMQLAAAGVGKLRIIDPDLLKPENLDRMPPAPACVTGLPKAKALGAVLADYRNDLTLSLLPDAINSDRGRAVMNEPTDLVVTCVDDDTGRLVAAFAARRTLTPHLDVATSIRRDDAGSLSIGGDCRLLLPGEGCVACVGGVEDFEEALYELSEPDGALRRRVTLPWDEQRAGSLASINSIVVGAGVQLWLDQIGGQLRSSYWQRLAWEPGTGLRVDGAVVGTDAECPVCHRRIERLGSRL